VKRLYKEACIEDCIGWLDPHNNKAFLTSQISCTNNAYSIMVSAKRDLPDMGKVIDHGLNPKGPAGRFHALVPVTHGVFAYGPIRRPPRTSCAGSWTPSSTGRGYPPATCTSPRTCTRSTSTRLGHRAAGEAVPEGARDRQAHVVAGAANRAHGAVINRWIVIDMFTKACTGTPTKNAIAEAVTQLKQIYG
jgi:multiple sugar transport system substrate-binding protein